MLEFFSLQFDFGYLLSSLLGKFSLFAKYVLIFVSLFSFIIYSEVITALRVALILSITLNQISLHLLDLIKQIHLLDTYGLALTSHPLQLLTRRILQTVQLRLVSPLIRGLDSPCDLLLLNLRPQLVLLLVLEISHQIHHIGLCPVTKCSLAFSVVLELHGLVFEVTEGRVVFEEGFQGDLRPQARLIPRPHRLIAFERTPLPLQPRQPHIHLHRVAEVTIRAKLPLVVLQLFLGGEFETKAAVAAL